MAPASRISAAIILLALFVSPSFSSETPSDLVRNSNLLLLRAATFDPTADIPQGLGSGLTPWRDQIGGRVLGIIQFAATPSVRDRAGLAKAGIERLYYLPNNAYLIRYDLQDAELLVQEAGVRALLRLPKWARVAPGLLETPAGPTDRIALEILAAPGRTANGLAATLAKRFAGAELITRDDQHAKGRLIVSVPTAELSAVVDLMAGMEDTLWIEAWQPKVLLNDNSIWVGQTYDTANTTNYALSATIWNHGLLGAGQTVCVNDSGLDSDMCYFRYDGTAGSKTEAQSPSPPDIGTLTPANKVVAYYVEPGADAYDNSAASYHGTHVTGSVAGDNYATLSSGTTHGHNSGDGMAPQAQIVFQDVGDSAGSLSGLSGDLTDMFQQAYDAGARIHSDSWGNESSAYDAHSMDMDEFMFRNQDFLFVVAMGNSGTAPGDGSIGAPATAKSIVSVGATTNGGASSHADNLMDYSRGPVDDGRLKPDIVSPGSSIISASGTTSNTDNNCSDKSLSGTSMATPTTSGYLALLREYFSDGFYPSGIANPSDALTPSGALMKAVLLVGGMPLAGTDYTNYGAVSSIPSMDQGWGRTHLDNSLYFTGDGRRLRVWDVRHESGLATGETAEFTVDITSTSEPLSVRLAWSDPESNTLTLVNLVNNLDLEVQAPGGGLYLGNVFSGGASTTGGSADVLNPVEGVVIPTPAVGTWTIRVRGAAVPGTGTAPYSDRQGFAVAAAFPECGSTAVAPTGLVATDSAPAGISLTWTGNGASSYLVYRALGSTPAVDAYSLVGTTASATYVDTTVQGGYSYSYVVRATDGCGESARSAPASAAYTGPCSLLPAFGGLEIAENDTGSLACDVVLYWSAGASSCPADPSVVYNIYRGSSPYFTPDPSNRIATTGSTTFTDFDVVPLETGYYVVRAEDASSAGGGPANGGNEDINLRMLSATPWASTSSPGTFTDDGGDTSAKLMLSGEWRVTNQENHTSGGGLSYHNAPDGTNHGAGQCAAATTPAITLQAGAPGLSYWTAYNVELNWDGVVVEVNDCNPTCDTGTWTPSNPVGTYPGDFSETGSPPINACGYPASQGAFNGPTGNGSLTGWAQFTHDLSAWAGQTVQVRWNFSSDGGFEVEGFYLDDIQITLASTPDGCSTNNGIVRLNGSLYTCSDTIGIDLADADLTGEGNHAVTLASGTEPGGESVSLTESPPGTGAFTATIATTDNPAAADGQLSVTDGDTVTVTYIDADDGLGGTNVAKVDTALVDCVGPAISVVNAVDVGAISATIEWVTNEASDSRVTYGPWVSLPPSTLVTDAMATMSHSVAISGLTECTKYGFLVASADPAGNLTSDDNSGGYFSLTTGIENSPVLDSTDTPLAIVDYATAESSLAVAFDKTVLDVNVQVDITHTYDSDLDIFLVSPTGTRVELTTDNGSSGDGFTGTIFDDEASIDVTSGSAPFTGSYRPETPLSAVDGESAIGTWVLEVSDDAGSDQGALNWWKLMLSFPAEACNAGAIFANGFEEGHLGGWSSHTP
jgi:subtilisin-like proprotein convertase family protein